MSGLTFAVPEVEREGVRAPAARPDGDHHVRYERDGVYVETDRWVDPPEGAEVVEGTAHDCETCGALFGSSQALAGHTSSHGDSEDEDADTSSEEDDADDDSSDE